MYARSDNFYFLHFFSTWCVIMKGTCVCVFQLILISLHPLCMLVYQLSTQQPDCTCMCVWGVPSLFHWVSLSLCRRRDKVIIFSDMVFALRSYAQKLQRWDSNFSLNCPESIFPSFLPPSSTSSLLLPSPFSLSLPLSFLLPAISLTVRQLKMSGCKFYKTLSTIPTSTPFSSPR